MADKSPPPYADVSVYLKPGRRIERKKINPDGTIEQMQVNPMPLKRKMVDKAGFVVEVSLTTGRHLKRLDQTNPYGIGMLYGPEALRPPDWLPFYECPYAKGHLPTPEGEKPCPLDGATLSDEQRVKTEMKHPDKPACVHLQKIIKARQGQRAAAEEEFRKNMMTNNERMVEMVANQARQLSQITTEDGGADGGPVFRKRRGGGD